MNNPRNDKSYQVTGTLIKAAIVSALGGLLFGFDTAVIAGTTASVKSLFQLSDWSMGFVVSSALIGTIVGSLISSKPADVWGRRDCLKVLAILFFISAVGCALAWDFWSLSVARFIGGIGIGGSSVISPMYITEIAPAKVRGRLVILFQFNVCLGILVAYLSNAMIELMHFDVLNLQWRIMFGAGGIPATLFFIMLFTIPRSPRWLMSIEVFPNKVRSKGQALGSFTHWGLCAIAALVYPPIIAISNIGLAIPFLFGCAMMILQFFVVWFFFIETKGVPLEQLELQLGVKDV